MDFYRWGIGGHTGGETVCGIARRASRRFGLILHTRGTRRLTIRALEQIEHSGPIDKNLFHARAARFSKLFGDMPAELRPFFFYEFEDPEGRCEPAYQMHSGREYVVVVGPTDGAPLDAVDWEYFLTPPSAPGQPRQQ
jgi:hypothetical protein